MAVVLMRHRLEKLDRDNTAHLAKNIYSLSLYRKSLLILLLGRWCPELKEPGSLSHQVATPQGNLHCGQPGEKEINFSYVQPLKFGSLL